MKFWIRRLAALAKYSPILVTLNSVAASPEMVDSFTYSTNEIVVSPKDGPKGVSLSWTYDADYAACKYSDSCEYAINAMISEENGKVTTKSVLIDSNESSYEYSIPVESLSSAQSLQFKIARYEDGLYGKYSSGGVIPVKSLPAEPLTVDAFTYSINELVVAPRDVSKSVFLSWAYDGNFADCDSCEYEIRAIISDVNGQVTHTYKTLDSEQGNYTYSIPVASLSSAKSLQFKIRRILEDGSEEPFLSGGIIPVKLSTDDPDSIQTVRYQHTDMLGSVVAESDEAGNILSRSHYEPFGKRLGGDKAGIGYTGHLQDKDLGLTYMQARYYDPLIGRFYSSDPIGVRDVHSFNRYAYANNNPYKYIDPTGEAAEGWMNRPGGVSIGQHQAAMGKAGGAAISRHPGMMVAIAAVKIVTVLNEASNTENKGQAKPEVGDCPTCGGDTSNKPGKVGNTHGLKPKQVKDKIHDLKGDAKLPDNPDVEVCNDCGEVFPQTDDGKLGDSIGNINEELD